MKHCYSKYIAAFAIYSLVLLVCINCSSKETINNKRMTVTNTPLLRVAIDEQIDETTARQVQTALLASGFYEVAERSSGWNALRREQDRQHRSIESVRFANTKERYAIFGEVYGVGSMISCHEVCITKYNIFSGQYRAHCTQFVSLVSTTTSKVIAAVRDEQIHDDIDISNWDNSIIKLTTYLKSLTLSDVDINYTPEMMRFRSEAKQRGLEEEKKNWKSTGKIVDGNAEDQTGEPLRYFDH